MLEPGITCTKRLVLAVSLAMSFQWTMQRRKAQALAIARTLLPTTTWRFHACRLRNQLAI